jgi:hypothetical protein
MTLDHACWAGKQQTVAGKKRECWEALGGSLGVVAGDGGGGGAEFARQVLAALSAVRRKSWLRRRDGERLIRCDCAGQCCWIRCRQVQGYRSDQDAAQKTSERR